MTLATMEATPRTRQPAPADDFAGLLSGVIAGLVYLLVQMGIAVVFRDGAGWEPLLRMAAVLMGEDAAPPGPLSTTVLVLALLIHLTVSAVYGSLVALLVRNSSVPAAVVRGMLFGAAVFVLHFWVIAPAAFPWFEASRTWPTAINHLLFGAVAALWFKRLGRQPG